MIVNMASKCLRKPMALPSLNKYRVHEGDLLANDDLLSFTKSKGFLFNQVSPMESRRICLTSNGQLVIYKKPTKGFILNVRKADSITTVSNSFKENRTISHQCHIKIHFGFGSVNLYVLNDKIGKWRKAIASVFEGKIQDGKREASVQKEIEAIQDEKFANVDHPKAEVLENSATVALSPPILRSDGLLAPSDSKTSVTSEITDSRGESFATVIEVPEAKRTKPVSTQISTDTSSNDSNKEENDTFDSFDTLLERFGKMSAELDQLHSQNQNMQKRASAGADSSNCPTKEYDDEEGHDLRAIQSCRPTNKPSKLKRMSKSVREMIHETHCRTNFQSSCYFIHHSTNVGHRISFCTKRAGIIVCEVTCSHVDRYSFTPNYFVLKPGHNSHAIILHCLREPTPVQFPEILEVSFVETTDISASSWDQKEMANYMKIVDKKTVSKRQTKLILAPKNHHFKLGELLYDFNLAKPTTIFEKQKYNENT